jgi:hypothetical protein
MTSDEAIEQLREMREFTWFETVGRAIDAIETLAIIRQAWKDGYLLAGNELIRDQITELLKEEPSPGE